MPVHQKLRARRAFTLVEVLVVLSVIAALMAILLVGLQTAQRATRRTKQTSDLKQLYLAWSQYTTSNDDNLLPGYLDDKTQEKWHVSYKYNRKANQTFNAQYCRTYPWRLMPYLDSIETLMGYLDMDETATQPWDMGGNFNAGAAQLVSEKPAFGYNAHYVGGWWTFDPVLNKFPQPKFGNALWTNAEGQQVKGGLVVTKSSHIKHTDDMVIFCASTHRKVGFYKEASDDKSEGSSLVVPHRLAKTLMWEPSEGDIFRGVSAGAHAGLATILGQTIPVGGGGQGMWVRTESNVPLRRFGAQVAVVNPDGHISLSGYGELFDQKHWINGAWDAGNSSAFEHEDTY